MHDNLKNSHTRMLTRALPSQGACVVGANIAR